MIGTAQTNDHASTVFEDYCRQQFIDAFDLVRNERRENAQQTLISKTRGNAPLYGTDIRT
jgi:hypothetical protein